jgi:DNA-binding MarR family transcriptional regulator
MPKVESRPPAPGYLWIGIQVDETSSQRDVLANELVVTLSSFGRWVSSIWNSETPFGRVSHRQITVLYLLRKRHFMAGLAATPTNFAQLLSVRKSVVTRVLASLESGGFIGRVSDPADKRSQIVVLTERGHHLSVYIEGIFLQEMIGSIEFLSEDEIDLLLRARPLLNQISANLENARKQRVALMGKNPYEDDGL